MRRTTHQSGFTLVEIISVMVIVGIMAAVAGFGIVTFMQGYATTRENVVIAQKASLVMGRIAKELEGVTAIDATSTDTCLRYRNSTLSDTFRRMEYKNGKIELLTDSAAGCGTDEVGKTLTDRMTLVGEGKTVVFLTYRRYDEATGAIETWDPAADAFDELAEIMVEFFLERIDGFAPNGFTLTITPRNTGAMKAPGVSF